MLADFCKKRGAGCVLSHVQKTSAALLAVRGLTRRDDGGGTAFRTNAVMASMGGGGGRSPILPEWVKREQGACRFFWRNQVKVRESFFGRIMEMGWL